MIDLPHVIAETSFQEAWIRAAGYLRSNAWNARNLVVQIADPTAIDSDVHQQVFDFTRSIGILTPKDVAYTIFPHRLYQKCGSASRLYEAYNRPGGLCERVIRRSANRWGTYFQRLTDYESIQGTVNQIEGIIEAIRSDASTYTSAFCMVIQKPGGETRRRLGGPCLNYIAVQLESGTSQTLGLFCVYRNHDFLERAYGNYWGLCNLLCFMAEQVDAEPGPLTCVASHAYVAEKKTALKSLLHKLP